MDEIIDFFAVTAAEFWVGIIVIGFAFFNLLLALRPERIYVDLPRGEFPRHGTNHPTRQVTGAPPPLRSQLPEMSVAEAGLGAHLERMGRVTHEEAMRHMQRARCVCPRR